MRDRLKAIGFPVCIYVPFGADRYSYTTRHPKENPRIAGHVFRAMFGL